MSIVFGEDPIRAEVEGILQALRTGSPVTDAVERQSVDLKEEHGRRDRIGRVLPGQSQNEEAAKRLFEAAACIANTPGGGALIVGVSNDGQLVGTELDIEWLRSRIWQLSGRVLTLDVAEAIVGSTRLLVLRAPQAIEPVRVENRIRWRVAAQCVEVDANTWHAKRMSVLNYDWSNDGSRVAVAEVRPAAVAVARELLRASSEDHAVELSEDSDTNLLRRLNVVTPDGFLTNAGVLAFVGREQPCLDYIRRARSGGDSLSRIRRAGRSMLEELVEVFQAVDANTSTVHLPEGLVVGQHREIPRRATREAIVNGLAHREWGMSEPTIVEHVGRLLRVTSPGGFFGGVTASNIITHPSRSRNRALAELLAALRIAEREGVGVDRMVTDMVSVGHPAPEIEEIEGPYVRVSLVGDDLDTSWIAWLRSIRPTEEAQDLNSLLILRHLVQVGWIDARTTAPLIQDAEPVARGALAKLARALLASQPVISPVEGAPAQGDPPWRLHPSARVGLERLDGQDGRNRPWPTREAVAASYAAGRGRISTTELASLVNAYPNNMGPILRGLEAQGVLAPAWASRRGQGFYYRFVGAMAGDPQSGGGL